MSVSRNCQNKTSNSTPVELEERTCQSAVILACFIWPRLF